MNTPKKFSILVWACNLTLAMLAIVIVSSCYYYTLVPGLVGLDTNFEGATKFHRPNFTKLSIGSFSF